MTDDATKQLIQRITSQLSTSGSNNQAGKTSFLASLNTMVGIAANYVQILTTIPGATAASADVVVAAAEGAAAAGGTGIAVAGAAAGAASAGIGAVLVVLVSFVIAAISFITGGSSDDAAAQLEKIFQTVVNTEQLTIDNYWHANQINIGNLWDQVYDDLHNISIQGVSPPGPDVLGQAVPFFNHAQSFVTNLLNVSNGYWDKPLVQDALFSAQVVNHPYLDDPLYDSILAGSPRPAIPPFSMGWYGNLPRPPQDTILSTTGNPIAPDPRSMLPVLLYAIQSYLSIMEVANQIDSNQYTFDKYVQKYSGDFGNYATFIYDQYTYAVGAQNPKYTSPYGLMKSDIPKFYDLLAFVVYNPPYNPPFSGTNEYPPGGLPSVGYIWNGVYGVVDQFGVYPSPANVPSATSQCIIDRINSNGMFAQASIVGLNASFLPYAWVRNKVVLGLMAQWKALYLFNGYDKVWGFLQHLRVLAGLAPYPTQHLPDGTIADQNWSARELCNILNLYPDSGGSLLAYYPGNFFVNGYSLFKLVKLLDETATGTWAGPTQNAPLSRPLSFRGLLAAAAV